MAITVISNKPRVSAVLHISAANASIVVAGNNSVSNLAVDSTEVLTGAYINQAVWGCDGTGYIVLKRGSTVVGVYDSTGQHDYSGCGMPLNVGSTQNISVEFVGSANSFIVIDLQKVGNMTANSDYFRG
jgi:hypothetical protein